MLLLKSLYLFWALTAVIPKDELVVNNQLEPDFLDPHRLSTINANEIVVNLFEGLVGRDSSYSKIVPGVATKWTISKDGRTYTFQIRPNLHWSNGDSLTVDQIRTSLLRAMAPDTANPYIEKYLDTIVGTKDYIDHFKAPDKKKYEDRVGIRVIAKDKLEFKLQKPQALFLAFLTQPFFYIVHPSMLDPNSPAWHTPEKFIGNGPFRLKEWTVNKQIVLEKNPYYWDAANTKLNKIVALEVNDQSTTYNLYKTGKIDWTLDNSVPSTLVPSLRADPEFHLSPGFATYMYVFNVKKKPLDDVRVRKALSMAIHRAEITDRVLRSGVIPAARYVPPGIPDYKPKIDPPKPFEKQIEEARALLSAAGYPGGKGFPSLTLSYNTNEGHHKVAQAVQEMWKKYLGIDIKIQNMEWKVLVSQQQAHLFDIVRVSWIGDIPDPANIMDIFQSESGNNAGQWSNKEFDHLFAEASSTMDTKKRMKTLAKAEQIVLDDAAVAPIYFHVFYSLLKPEVQGFVPNMFSIYQLKYFYKR